MNTHELGARYEQIAADYLKKGGYNILYMNYRCRFGEIDIIARDGSYLVFVEVKYRKNLNMGSPFEAVDIRKQQKIRRVCEWFLMEKKLYDIPVRFDVVGITNDKVELCKNAF